MGTSSRGRYFVAIVGVAVGVLALACGGGSPAAAPTQATAKPAATPAPTATAAAKAEPAAQPAAAQRPADIPTPTQAQRIAAPPAQDGSAFTWEIEDVDTGALPALALTGDGVPHVAYMLEDMPGFVKNAVRKARRGTSRPSPPATFTVPWTSRWDPMISPKSHITTTRITSSCPTRAMLSTPHSGTVNGSSRLYSTWATMGGTIGWSLTAGAGPT